jgi:hypothetical protein
MQKKKPKKKSTIREVSQRQTMATNEIAIGIQDRAPDKSGNGRNCSVGSRV